MRALTQYSVGATIPITTALSQVLLPPDDDSGEQAALGLTVDTADISSNTAPFTPFTITGLELDDSGIVTFTDANGTAVQIDVNGIQTAYFADLSSLADGPITSTLAVNTDPVGNSFAAVAGNTVNLDQDSGEQLALNLTVNGNSGIPIGPATAGNVSFTVAGVDPEDTATVTFTDQNGNSVSISVNGVQVNYTADLTSLADGPITSTLSVDTDPAGNTFAPVDGNAVTLDANPAQISSVSSTTDSGATDLNAGHVVTITVETTEPVTVDTSNGSPFLTLNNGEVAAYQAGSGTNALTFTYTVQFGDNSSDLQVTRLDFNGGSIYDALGGALAGSAAADLGLQIDTIPPSLFNYSFSDITEPLAVGGTYVDAMNGLGQIIGTYDGSNGSQSFLYDNGAYTELVDPFAAPNSTYVTAINSSGQVLGYYTDTGNMSTRRLSEY
jgi:hypothetical protein